MQAACPVSSLASQICDPSLPMLPDATSHMSHKSLCYHVHAGELMVIDIHTSNDFGGNSTTNSTSMTLDDHTFILMAGADTRTLVFDQFPVPAGLVSGMIVAVTGDSISGQPGKLSVATIDIKQEVGCGSLLGQWWLCIKAIKQWLCSGWLLLE